MNTGVPVGNGTDVYCVHVHSYSDDAYSKKDLGAIIIDGVGTFLASINSVIGLMILGVVLMIIVWVVKKFR